MSAVAQGVRVREELGESRAVDLASLRFADSRGVVPTGACLCRRTAGSSPAFGALGMTSSREGLIAALKRRSTQNRIPWSSKVKIPS
jgi:hypothetical protein